MTRQEKILELYSGLSLEDKKLVLDKLNKIDSEPESKIRDKTFVSLCPHCESSLIVKNGKRAELQKYKCKTCCKTFSYRTKSCLHKIKKTEKFKAYKSLMFENYYTLKQMASKIGISIQTSFDWRHKILSSLNNEDVTFPGITEIDDIWFLYSQKEEKD